MRPRSTSLRRTARLRLPAEPPLHQLGRPRQHASRGLWRAGKIATSSATWPPRDVTFFSDMMDFADCEIGAPRYAGPRAGMARRTRQQPGPATTHRPALRLVTEGGVTLVRPEHLGDDMGLGKTQTLAAVELLARGACGKSWWWRRVSQVPVSRDQEVTNRRCRSSRGLSARSVRR